MIFLLTSFIMMDVRKYVDIGRMYEGNYEKIRSNQIFSVNLIGMISRFYPYIVPKSSHFLTCILMKNLWSSDGLL